MAGDIYEDFNDMDSGLAANAYEKSDGKTTNTGQPVCQYQDVNQDRISDYFVVTDRNGDGTITDDDLDDGHGGIFINPKTINIPLTKQLAENVH